MTKLSPASANLAAPNQKANMFLSFWDAYLYSKKRLEKMTYTSLFVRFSLDK